MQVKTTMTLERGDEDIDVVVEGYMEAPDRSVGYAGGAVIERVYRPDTKEAIELTEAEEKDACESLTDVACDIPDEDPFAEDYDPYDRDDIDDSHWD